MCAKEYCYDPDYTVPPGWILKDELEYNNFSQAEFARKCGRTPKLISEIISGKAPIETETAIQFERVTGINADLWLRMESRYRRHLAQKKESEEAQEWINSFPLAELIKRNYIDKPKSKIEKMAKLLEFFGVGSIDGWKNNYCKTNVQYRHSQSYKSNEFALSSWLRIGEIEADKQKCLDYNKSNFMQAANIIRGLTNQPVEECIHAAIDSCNQAGVALVITPPLKKVALSGATQWIHPRKAIIQLTARHKTNDHFWFGFFHEAAHILLHSRKKVYIEGENSSQKGEDRIEVEANEWASNILVPKKDWTSFTYKANFSKAAVLDFARKKVIAPGIIVGMLQRKELIPYSHLNNLKQKVELKEI